VKKILLKVLTGTILLAFLFFCHNTRVNAALITRTLDNDTILLPPGVMAVTNWWAAGPKFKKGTVVTINEHGEVLEGTLVSAAFFHIGVAPQLGYLVSSDWDRNDVSHKVPFQDRIRFNDKGEVIKGTIGSCTEIPLNQVCLVELAAHTEVSFYDNGRLQSGTLQNDTYLRPVGWLQILTQNYIDNVVYPGVDDYKNGPRNDKGEVTYSIEFPGFVEFKSRTQFELNDKGEITKGTLNKDAKLLSPDGIKLYVAGTMVDFDDNGVVVKASKE